MGLGGFLPTMLIKIVFCFQFYVISVLLVYSQLQEYHGVIVDSSTDNPIPYVHLLIEGTTKGTIASSEGQFTLYTHNVNPIINVTAIGYDPKRIKLNSSVLYRIHLQPSTTFLNEVVIYSQDYARNIVRNAIENISSNYSSQSQKQIGFLREIVSKDPTSQEPYYISEAEVEIFKEPYGESNKKGQVQILKGRKSQSSEIDSLFTRIYGGPHLSHRFDWVARMDGPLDVKSLDRFQFSIVDTLSHLGSDLFKIKYQGFKGLSGHLFIQDSTFAVVRIDQANTKQRLIESLKSLNRLFLRSTTDYEFQDSTWRLKSIIYRTAFEYKGKTVYLNSEYSATSSQATTEEIPYADRLEFRDIFTSEVETYQPDYWEGFNTIQTDSLIEKTFEYHPPKDGELSKRDKIYSVLSRVEFRYGLVYTKNEIATVDFNYSDEISISGTVPGSSSSRLGYSTSLEYSVGEKWKIGYLLISSISPYIESGAWLGLSTKFNLKKQGRPLYLNPGCYFGYQSSRHKVLEYPLDNTETIQGKTFDAESIDVFIENRSISILPTLSIIFERNGRFNYFIKGGYNYQFGSKSGLFLVEDEWFLKRKHVFVDSKKASLEIGADNPLIKNNYQLSFGMQFSF